MRFTYAEPLTDPKHDVPLAKASGGQGRQRFKT